LAAFADGLLTTRQAECVDCELAANGASKFRGNIVLRQGAVGRVSAMPETRQKKVDEIILDELNLRFCQSQ